MANWCFATVALVGQTNTVVELKKYLDGIINAIPSDAKDYHTPRTFRILKHLGIERHSFSDTGYLNQRHTSDILPVKGYGNLSYVMLYHQTRWIPEMGVWKSLCEFFPGIDISYMAEEPDNKVYKYYDDYGIFDEIYLIEANIPEKLANGRVEAYRQIPRFRTVEEVISYLKELTGQDFISLREASRYCRELLYSYTDDEYYLHIYAYEETKTDRYA